jgi:hypothetical protein
MMIRSLALALTLIVTAICSAQPLAPQTKTLETEPFDKLSIQGIPFQTVASVAGESDKHDGYTRELVRVQWRAGDPVDLYIVKPVGASVVPVTLFLYSWPSGTDRFYDDAWCRTVTQRGIAAVGFASALTGGRYHDRPWKQWFVSELPEALAKSVHDVQLILNYLETRHDLDTSRIGMFGQGSGGTIALLAASVEPRLKAVDVLDAWGDWPDWYAASPIVPSFQRGELNKTEFLHPLEAMDPVNMLPTLDPSRVRFQEVTLNPVNPDAAKIKLRAAARNHPLIQYSTEQDYRERAMKDGAILQWLTGKLKKPAS